MREHKAFLSLLFIATIPFCYAMKKRKIREYRPISEKVYKLHKDATYYMDWLNENEVISGSRDCTSKTIHYSYKHTKDTIKKIGSFGESAILTLAINPYNPDLITFGTGYGELILWKKEANVWKTLCDPSDNESLYAVAWHPSEADLIACGLGTYDTSQADGVIKIVNIKTNKDYTLTGRHSDIVYELSWNKTNQKSPWLGSASFDGTAKIWSIDLCNQEKSYCIATTQVFKDKDNENKPIQAYDIEWHPLYSRIFAVSYQDGKIRIYYLNNKRECIILKEIAAHKDIVHSIKWHPTRRTILFSGSFDNTFKIWKLSLKDQRITKTRCLYSSSKQKSKIYFVYPNKHYPKRIGIGYEDGSLKTLDFEDLLPQSYVKPTTHFCDIKLKYNHFSLEDHFKNLSIEDKK